MQPEKITKLILFYLCLASRNLQEFSYAQFCDFWFGFILCGGEHHQSSSVFHLRYTCTFWMHIHLCFLTILNKNKTDVSQLFVKHTECYLLFFLSFTSVWPFLPINFFSFSPYFLTASLFYHGLH